MKRNLCSLLAVVAAGGTLMTGCGGSSTSSTAPTSSTSSAASSASTTSTTSAAAGSGLASNPTVVAAVARCKASINAAQTLSASAKSKLATICDEAAKGDPASLKKAEARICVELIKDTVPAAAQTQALASCPKA